MIRPTVPADTPRLLELTAQTGLFRPAEIDTLKEVLDDYPDLEAEDIRQALSYAAWLAHEEEAHPLHTEVTG